MTCDFGCWGWVACTGGIHARYGRGAVKCITSEDLNPAAGSGSTVGGARQQNEQGARWGEWNGG
jgi:hypothetical protein